MSSESEALPQYSTEAWNLLLDQYADRPVFVRQLRRGIGVDHNHVRAIDAIQAALTLRDEAFRAGGEAMREAAVKIANDQHSRAPDDREHDGYVRASSIIEELILALPPAQTEGAE